MNRPLALAGSLAATVGILAGSLVSPLMASSHREAPGISRDPTADNTDVYAFVSPDRPDTVTLIANYIPLQHPAGGPNFNSFGDDVLYEINVDNKGDGKAHITYQFRFDTKLRNANTFLYNTGQITSLDDPDWNQPQTYSVTRVENGKRQVLADKVKTPPVNIGPRSTPDYDSLSDMAVPGSARHRQRGGLQRPHDRAAGADFGSHTRPQGRQRDVKSSHRCVCQRQPAAHDGPARQW
jgi:hypothetical protein